MTEQRPEIFDDFYDFSGLIGQGLQLDEIARSGSDGVGEESAPRFRSRRTDNAGIRHENGKNLMDGAQNMEQRDARVFLPMKYSRNNIKGA